MIEISVTLDTGKRECFTVPRRYQAAPMHSVVGRIDGKVIREVHDVWASTLMAHICNLEWECKHYILNGDNFDMILRQLEAIGFTI